VYRLEGVRGRFGGIEYLLGQARQNNKGRIDGPFRRGISRAIQRHTLTIDETDPPDHAEIVRAHNDAQQERERRHRIEIGTDSVEDHWLGYVEPVLRIDTPGLMRAAKGIKPEPGEYIARLDGPHLPKMGDPQKSYLKAVREKSNLPEREGTHLAILFRHVNDYEDDQRAWVTLRHFIAVGGHRWLTDRLVIAHLKMVPPRVFRSRHDDRDRWDDLNGAGSEGLMIAVGGYDYTHGFQFNTYAHRSIVSAIKDCEQEIRSAVHRASSYWEKLEDAEAVFDASLNFDGGGRPLSEVFADGDEVLPLRDGEKIKKTVYPLRGRVNNWTPLDKDHCKRMRVWLSALWARRQRHHLDKAARLFLDEWRTVYGAVAALPSHGRIGFEYLCRSRRISTGSRSWTLWVTKPLTLVASHTQTTRAVWKHVSAYAEANPLPPRRDRHRQCETANRDLFYELYWPRLNAAEAAASGGMFGFFAGAGGDAHDAAGYSGDFKDGFGGEKKKRKTYRWGPEEHQEIVVWDRPKHKKAWKSTLRLSILEDAEIVRKAYKDQRPEKKMKCRKIGSELYLTVTHGDKGMTVTHSCFGQPYVRLAPETVVLGRSAPLPAEHHYHPYSGGMWETQRANGAHHQSDGLCKFYPPEKEEEWLMPTHWIMTDRGWWRGGTWQQRWWRVTWYKDFYNERRNEWQRLQKKKKRRFHL
jgi:hypothetical protein